MAEAEASRWTPSGCKQAIRRADLLLVHLADPEALARELSRCEAGATARGSIAPPPSR